MSWALNSLDNVSAALTSQADNRQAIAQSAMSRGATHLQNLQYDLAVADFKMAAAFAPDSAQPPTLLARTYSLMGRTQDAIDAYQRALQADPTASDVRGELAKKYLDLGRDGDAQAQYREILNRDPQDAGALESLGFLDLKAGRMADANAKFEQVARLAPQDASAYYSLGLLRVKQGSTSEAIDFFKQAIALNPGYSAARADLAYAYLDLHRTDLAQEQMNALYDMNTKESVGYANSVSHAIWTPQILFVDSAQSTFDLHRGSLTPLSQLDPALATPGASATFQVKIQFNQNMDIASVQNVANWSMHKAFGGEGGVYNNGAGLSGHAQISLPPMPLSVSYDPLTNQATLTFSLRQNAAGNGVIDPQHWVFQFSGTDVDGRPMDSAGDEYDAWAGHPF